MNIEVNYDELKRVSERIDDMSFQLIDTNSSNVNAFSAINGEIQTSSINSTLKDYSDTCVRVVNALNNDLIKFKEFLDRQLVSYSTTDQEAFEAIKNVSDYLSGLGTGLTAATITPKEGMTPEQLAAFKDAHQFNNNGSATVASGSTSPAVETPKAEPSPTSFQATHQQAMRDTDIHPDASKVSSYSFQTTHQKVMGDADINSTFTAPKAEPSSTSFQVTHQQAVSDTDIHPNASKVSSYSFQKRHQNAENV